LIRAAVLGAVALALALTSPARSQQREPLRVNQSKAAPPPATLQAQLAKDADLPEAKVDKLLKALGPAVLDQIKKGQQVELPGLGVLRVVRIPEHRDLINGRPGTIAATNYVEFLPMANVVTAANAPGAVPAVTVPQYEFNPLPNQTRGGNVGGTRQPSVRIR
jgi:nucleoid DNA-binding protein